MAERDFDAEFEEMTAPLKERLSEEAKQDEWRVYSFEDRAFRQSIIERVAKLTGVQIGKDFFSDQA